MGRDELPDAFEDGMGFDGSLITGFNRIEESDMIAMPDPAPSASFRGAGKSTRSAASSATSSSRAASPTRATRAG